MKNGEYISASEVSEFSFCNVAYYLDMEGYPRGTGSSERMENGRQMHSKLEPSYKRVGLGLKITVGAMVIALISLIIVFLEMIH